MSRAGLLIALAATLGACGEGTTHYVGSQRIAEGGASGGSPTVGCPLAPGTNQYVSLDSSDRARRLLISVPEDYDPDRAYPVVFGFHARDEDGAFIQGELGLEAEAPRWAIYVYPDGLDREWTDGSHGTGWQNGPATTYYGGTEDLTFVSDVLTLLEGELCVSTEKLFAVGRWWGAEFASVVGCYLGDRFDAIVAAHGNEPYYLPLEAESEPPCVGEVGVWGLHGKGDAEFPLQCGLDQRDFWLRQNDCDPDSATTVNLPGTGADDDCVEYSCPGPPVGFCAFAAEFGQTIPDYFAANAIAFLQAQ